MKAAVGFAATILVAVLGMVLYGRMSAWTETARRQATLAQRLEAAREVIARDLRQDGYGMARIAPVSGLPPTGEAILGFVRVDDTARTQAVAVQGQQVTVASSGGLLAGDVVAVGGAGGSCLGRIERLLPGALELDRDFPCAAQPGAEIVRLVLRHYRLAGGELAVSDAPGGAWRILLEGVDSLALTSVRDEMYTLAIAGHTIGDARIAAASDGLVFARNRGLR
jgi:hypothetical protein